MPHPHDALIQAHLDGELAPAEMLDIDRHLASCGACQAVAHELARLSASLSEVVRRLDAVEPASWRSAAPPPSVSSNASRRAGPRQRPPHLRLVAPERSSGAKKLSTWRWAAAALVLITGAASAAVVGAPLLRGPRHVPAVPPATSPASSSMLRTAGAIAVAPVRDEMSVILSDAGAGSRLFVTATDRAGVAVSVRADSAHAAPARFRAGDARVVVQLAGAAMVVSVEFPRGLRSGRVLVGDSVVASIVNGSVTPSIAAVDGIQVGASR